MNLNGERYVKTEFKFFVRHHKDPYTYVNWSDEFITKINWN